MAQDIATVQLTGRLTRDAELNDSGKVLRIGLASNYGQKDSDGDWAEEVSFFTLKILGKRASSLAKHLLQGQQVAISGSLRQERWTNGDDEKRSAVVVLVNDLVFGQKAKGADEAKAGNDGDDDGDGAPF